MGIVQVTKDALVSLVNNMGKRGFDKAASTEYVAPLLGEVDLYNAYRSSWLARKIVNIPAFDACRRWRNWQAPEDQIGKIEEEERRLGLQQKLLRGMVQARLLGGAALYISTGDPNPAEPLDPASIKVGGIRYINIIPKRNLSAGDLELNPESEWYYKPKWYDLRTSTNNAVQIHPSRLVILAGDDLPDTETPITAVLQGWSDSVLVSAIEAIRNVDSTAANIASLIFEAKVDVIRVPDLMASLAHPEYEERLLSRFGIANVAKGNHGMLLLDKEEEYGQKTGQFQTLPDILRIFLEIVSGAADIPLTRLLGTSPGGLNATGESDLRNYYDRVQAEQNVSLRPRMSILDECLIRSALGSRPDDIHYIWASLWQLTDKERAEIGKTNADMIDKLNASGLYPPEALANAGANLLVENSVLPGFVEAIEDAGGLPDYEAELEAERKLEEERLAAAAKKPVQVGDAAPKSLYVRRDVLNVDEIKAFYERQGLEVTVDNLHVTIIHSETPVDWFKAGQAWDAKLTLVAGGARDHALFGPPGLEDSVVLMIKSLELEWRHNAFKEAGAVSSYTEYQPHITLRYKNGKESDFEGIEPFRGEIVFGPEIFEEVKKMR